MSFKHLLFRGAATSLLFTSLFAVMFAFADERNAQYGRWERYSAGKLLKYPDLDLSFLGTEPGAFYPGSTERRLGDIFRFEAKKSEEKTNVRWSSGTGDIGGTGFHLAGEEYVLEMATSSIFEGFVSEDNVMIWRKKDFEVASKKRIEELNKKYTGQR